MKWSFSSIRSSRHWRSFCAPSARSPKKNGNSTFDRYSRCVFGEYYLASDEAYRWTATAYVGQNRVAIADDSKLHAPYAGEVSGLYIGTNASFVVGSMATPGRICSFTYGEMVNQLILPDWDFVTANLAGWTERWNETFSVK